MSSSRTDESDQRDQHLASRSMDVQSRQPNGSSKPYLSPKQQDLLLAALNSQAGGASGSYSKISKGVNKTSTMTGDEAKALFMSPQDAELDNFDVDFTPDLDYLDGDNSYDFDNADLGGEMIGALPGSGADTTENGEHAEKRKADDDYSTLEEGDPKRRETQEGEKTAKKPGRKPLTSEPTTKRKAQNRAAQRAFRERKEKHLKDLETKVAELEKAQEADKHENELLKAEVNHLQVKLKDYRKRMSLNNSGASHSPPVNTHSQQRSNSNPLNGSNFQFDFPKFGALPGSQIFGNQNFTGSNSLGGKRNSATPSTTANSPGLSSRHGSLSQSRSARENSSGRSLSPTSNATSPSQIANLVPSFTAYSTNNNMHGFASTLPQMGGTNDPFGELFSPSILKSAGMNNYFGSPESPEATQNGKSPQGGDGGDNGSGFSRVFQFNSGSSVSDSTSPGASSLSQWNLNGATNSSCGTSPEPSHDSPANKDKSMDGYNNKISPQMSFGGSTQVSNNNNNNNNFTSPSNLINPLNASNDFSMPSVGNFDPVLFGDYRDSHDAIIGNGDFTGGFFDDALNSATFDYPSPSNLFGILQSPQQVNQSLNVNNAVTEAPKSSKNLMAEMDKVRDGGDDDYGLPGTKPKKVEPTGKMISCNNIWNQLQSNPDFQDGKFDLDSLCSELRMKARCSESGVMVDQAHVNAALKKLGKKDENGKVQDPPSLMFEQASWDNVLQKLGNSRQV